MTGHVFAQSGHDITLGLQVPRPGEAAPRILDVTEALQRLAVPSVSIALIEYDRITWMAALGRATTRTIYQAASLSKSVTAVAALRLVRQGRLDLNGDVNARLHSWHVPPGAYAATHPVTLRELLSMTAGINVPGDGYAYSGGGYQIVQALPS